MTFLEQCENIFGSKDLYTALCVPKDASQKDIKTAYYKMSRKVHPDRVPEEEKESATEKFQLLGKIYKVLSNEEQRNVYDESGYVEEEEGNEIFDWRQFWSSRFGDILGAAKQYTDDYWGSKKEEEDVKEAYETFKGNMDKIMETIYCRTLDDEPRYRKLIQGWISNKEVKAYKAFTEESERKRLARKRKYEKEKKLASKNAKTFEKEMGNSMSDIAKVIAQRNEDRLKAQDAFLDDLAAKYAKPKKSKKGPAKSKAGTSKKHT